MDRNTRNYGIDLLKVVSMLGVVVLHILSHGGLMSAVQGKDTLAVASLIEIIAYPAVDCFVIVSGFVSYRQGSRSPKFKNLINLYVITFFYSSIITIVAKLLAPNRVSIIDLLVSFLPVLTKRCWYFTSYFIMMLFAPLLNCAVENANAKMLGLSACLIVFMGFVDSAIEIFSLNAGHSVVWFLFLYLIGATVKKYDLLNRIPCGISCISIIGAIVITWIVRLVFGSVGFEISGNQIQIGKILTSYCSPTVLLMALGWLVLFSRITLKKAAVRFLTVLSSSSFAVYLIHDNETVRKLLIKNHFGFLSEMNGISLILCTLAIAILIFTVCICIDKARMLLFRCLKIDQATVKMEQCILRISSVNLPKRKDGR